MFLCHTCICESCTCNNNCLFLLGHEINQSFWGNQTAMYPVASLLAKPNTLQDLGWARNCSTGSIMKSSTIIVILVSFTSSGSATESVCSKIVCIYVYKII